MVGGCTYTEILRTLNSSSACEEGRNPQQSLVELQNEIIRCVKCPRLINHCREVATIKRRMYMEWVYWGKPVPSFGDPNAQIMLLGLAPAAHGANRTGRMFTGDRSGDWVYRTLHKYGYAKHRFSHSRCDQQKLHNVYITGAVHCAPPLNKPTNMELSNCKPYLIRELKLLKRLKVIIALGGIAFKTYLGLASDLDLYLPSPRPRFGHNLRYQLGEGKWLVTSYHPSQQNTQTGRLTEEMFGQVFQTTQALLS